MVYWSSVGNDTLQQPAVFPFRLIVLLVGDQAGYNHIWADLNDRLVTLLVSYRRLEAWCLHWGDAIWPGFGAIPVVPKFYFLAKVRKSFEDARLLLTTLHGWDDSCMKAAWYSLRLASSSVLRMAGLKWLSISPAGSPSVVALLGGFFGLIHPQAW